MIGEISNKSEPSRKFIQTFVLAEQPNGYYVLNDIFRYLADEEEELESEEATAPVPEAPKTAEPAPAAEAQVTDEAAANKVDAKLEQEVNGEIEQPEAAPQTNGTPAEEAQEAQKEQDEQAPVPVVDAELVKDEGVATPEPTPVSEQQEAPAQKESAPAPSLPKTWANIASKSGAKAPVVPTVPVTAPKAAAPATPAAPSAAPSAAQPAAQPAPAAEARPQDSAPNDAGWQTAGADHKKTQSRAGEEQIVLGYMKNVTDKVDANQLKQTLSRFGKLKYFDVSRAKVRAHCLII